MFMIRTYAMLGGILFAVASAGASAQSPMAQRGMQLYDTFCGVCHQLSVHSRPKRVARSVGDIRAYVKRWSGVAGLTWTSDEIEEVTLYLNERFYRFVSPYEKG